MADEVKFGLLPKPQVENAVAFSDRYRPFAARLRPFSEDIQLT